MFLLHRGCGHLFPSLFCGDSSFSLRQFLVVSGGFEFVFGRINDDLVRFRREKKNDQGLEF